MPQWSDKKLYDRILSLLTQKEQGYVKFNKARESIINLMRPDLVSELNLDANGDGSFFGDDIYDGIGSWSVGVMAKGFQGGLVSADADWQSHETGNSLLDDLDEVSRWLQEIDDHMTNAYQKSNFFRVLPAFSKDGVSIGSPMMFIEETDIVAGVVTFLPQHYSTVFAFYDGNNKLEGVIIKDDKWTVKMITDKFASTEEKQKAKMPEGILNQIRDGEFHEEHTMFRAVFKTKNPVWDVPGFNKPSQKWTSVYFLEKTTEDQKNNPLKTEQYFTKPMVTWDYAKNPWESVSRTPAFSAIHDVHSQQDMALDQATNRKLKNTPPMAVREDHQNIVDFNPGGITPIAKSDWGQIPTVIDIVGDLRLSREELEFGAENVKRWFLTAEFLKFTDLTGTLRQQPTATQIIKIAAELATQVNPGITTFTGFLSEVDERMIDIEQRAGRGPFRPERLEQVTLAIINALTDDELPESIELTPVFTGPLARAQKVKQELDPILEGLGIASPMFDIWPNLKTAVKEYGTLEKIFKATGFPLTEMKSEDEYNEIVAAINELAAQREQAAQEIEMLKASKNVQGPVDESSVLATVAGGQ
jgi:hypothetical protein